ncbi:hypothetical protein L7F22_004461 [Adiantum nelumboides]|nr:hypothetical protein [Adiantum nelumboides]
MDALSLIKDCLHEDFEDARRAWEGPAPDMEVRIPVQELMDPVAQYALNAVILFFPGRMPTAQDVGQWMQLQHETVSQLNDENNRMITEVKGLRKSMENAEQKFQKETQLLQKSELEVQSLKEKLCVEEISRKAAEDRCALKAVELENLAEHFNSMTCDFKLVKTQLVTAVSEKENLVEDLKNLTTRLNYCEQVICAKEEEEKVMSNAYDQLVEEHQQLKLAAIELDAQVQQQSFQLHSTEELLKTTQDHSNFLEDECREQEDGGFCCLSKLEKEVEALNKEKEEWSKEKETKEEEKTKELEKWKEAQAEWKEEEEMQEQGEINNETKEAIKEELTKALTISLEDKLEATKDMEKQLEMLSRSLAQQSSILENMQREKTALMSQLSSSKQTTLELESRNTALIREVAATESNNQLLTSMIQGKIQEAESFASRYRLEHERVRELEQLLACFRAQEHQLQLESKDSGAKSAILKERLFALEEQVCIYL